MKACRWCLQSFANQRQLTKHESSDHADEYRWCELQKSGGGGGASSCLELCNECAFYVQKDPEKRALHERTCIHQGNVTTTSSRDDHRRRSFSGDSTFEQDAPVSEDDDDTGSNVAASYSSSMPSPLSWSSQPPSSIDAATGRVVLFSLVSSSSDGSSKAPKTAMALYRASIRGVDGARPWARLSESEKSVWEAKIALDVPWAFFVIAGRDPTDETKIRLVEAHYRSPEEAAQAKRRAPSMCAHTYSFFRKLKMKSWWRQWDVEKPTSMLLALWKRAATLFCVEVDEHGPEGAKCMWPLKGPTSRKMLRIWMLDVQVRKNHASHKEKKTNKHKNIRKRPFLAACLCILSYCT